MVAGRGAAARPEARGATRRQHRLRLGPHDARAARQPARSSDVDTIEIERTMVEGARLFRPRNARAYDGSAQPHPHRGREDLLRRARQALRHHRLGAVESLGERRLDALLGGVLRARAGATSSDDGLLVQWIQAYEIDVDLLSIDLQGAGHGSSPTTRCTARRRTCSWSRRRRGRMPAAGRRAVRLSATSRRTCATWASRALADLHGDARGQAAPASSRSSTRVPTARRTRTIFPILDQHAPRARFQQRDGRRAAASCATRLGAGAGAARRRSAHAA